MKRKHKLTIHRTKHPRLAEADKEPERRDRLHVLCKRAAEGEHSEEEDEGGHVVAGREVEDGEVAGLVKESD